MPCRCARVQGAGGNGENAARDYRQACLWLAPGPQAWPWSLAPRCLGAWARGGRCGRPALEYRRRRTAGRRAWVHAQVEAHAKGAATSRMRQEFAARAGAAALVMRTTGGGAGALEGRLRFFYSWRVSGTAGHPGRALNSCHLQEMEESAMPSLTI